MRWLLDQGLPRSAATILNVAHEDAIHIGDVGMSEAPDPAILRHALSENRIIVTLDADFHALLALSGSSKPSVIRIREEGLKGPQLAACVSQIRVHRCNLPAAEDDKMAGYLGFAPVVVNTSDLRPSSPFRVLRVLCGRNSASPPPC